MATARSSFRERVREQMRTATLDAARELAVERGWRHVRMGDVAAAVGISRQTLYAEFQNKDTLAEALAVRELELLLASLSSELDQFDGTLYDVVRAGVTFVLDQADANPMLHAALTVPRPADDELLPLLLRRVEPVVVAAHDILLAFAGRRFPELDAERLSIAIDALIRLVISYLVLPVHPHDEVGARVATVIVCSLGLSPDSGTRQPHQAIVAP